MTIRTGVLVICILFLAASLPFFACGGAGNDDDDSGDAGIDAADDDNGDGSDYQDYLDAIPSSESIAVTIPGDEEKSLGEMATLYNDTVDFSREVNSHVLGMLSAIDEITSYPPTGHDGETYVWGPWIDSGLDPVEMRFDMTRVADMTYDYYLRWRPKNTEDEWTDVWTGHTIASTDTSRRGQGNFTIDFTAAKALDPARNEEGLVEVDYDTVTDGRQIAIVYSDFFDSEEDMPGPVDATYDYYNHADNSGVFNFDWYADIHWDQYHGTQYGKIEHSWFNTRWMPDGRGRADVVIKEGDIVDIHFGEDITATEYDVSECWDSAFLRVYYTEIVQWDNATSNTIEGYPEGEESACAFGQELPGTN